RIHAHALVAVDPPARLGINLLARRQNLLEDVAVTMKPDDPLVLQRGKAVHEEAGRAEEHVGDALLARKTIIQRPRRRQELMLAHLNRLPWLQVDREDMARAIA